MDELMVQKTYGEQPWRERLLENHRGGRDGIRYRHGGRAGIKYRHGGRDGIEYTKRSRAGIEHTHADMESVMSVASTACVQF